MCANTFRAREIYRFAFETWKASAKRKSWEILMIHRCFIVLCLFAMAPNLRAQEPLEEVMHVTIRPAAAPVPALKYEFLPEFRDQVSGNALVHYHRAYLMMGKSPGPDDPYWKWIEMPAKELPRDQVRKFLQKYHNIF